MGFFDFMKGAGQPAPKPEPVNMTKDYSPEEIKRLNERRIAMGLVEHGPERMGELIVFPDGKGGTVTAKIVSPVFYDPEGEKQNV